MPGVSDTLYWFAPNATDVRFWQNVTLFGAAGDTHFTMNPSVTDTLFMRICRVISLPAVTFKGSLRDTSAAM